VQNVECCRLGIRYKTLHNLLYFKITNNEEYLRFGYVFDNIEKNSLPLLQ